MTEAHVAVDFGGGSGRVIAGWHNSKGELQLDEVYRFGNRQVRLGHHLYWDFPSLYADMVEGLRKAALKYHILSVGIDTWGVDFGLIDSAGNLLSNPVCYRDEATVPFFDRFRSSRSTERHYSQAGIQQMPINSLYRLLSMAHEQPKLLDCAYRLLFMPDLFSYFLTGNPNCEYSIASTSELIDARTRSWNFGLIEELNLPKHIFGTIVMPGTVRGEITPEVSGLIGVGYPIPVVAIGSHDTASAVYASKAGRNSDGSYTAFLSSGTWSLLGVLLDEPLLTKEAHEAGFTNEGGVGGKIRFLQNITGLWILQRLVAEWQKQGIDPGYDTLIAEAEASDIESVIDVDSAEFNNPICMAAAIAVYCKSHGMAVPETRGELTRVAIQSLAHRYAKGFRAMEKLLDARISAVNILGGGSRNAMLNRLTAEKAGVEVIAGPVEATAIGNIMLQHNSLSSNQQSS